ncbi:hypothetical protein JCM10135_10160 [Stetteria hydrogenophila]
MSGLGEVKTVDVGRSLRLASTGFALSGLGLLLAPLMGAGVLWVPNVARVGSLPVPERAVIATLPVLLGFLMVYKGFSDVARRSGWTLLLEGLASWGILLFSASLFYGYTGWTAMLWWVGLVDPETGQTANVLVSLLLAIIGSIALYLSASSITPSINLAYNLFKADDLVPSALTVYKISSAVSLTVYPLIGAAASLVMIGVSLATANRQVPVRVALLEVAGGQPS